MCYSRRSGATMSLNLAGDWSQFVLKFAKAKIPKRAKIWKEIREYTDKIHPICDRWIRWHSLELDQDEVDLERELVRERIEIIKKAEKLVRRYKAFDKRWW